MNYHPHRGVRMASLRPGTLAAGNGQSPPFRRMRFLTV